MESLRDALRQSRVADLGPLPAPRIALNVTLQQALQFLVRGRRGAIVVLDGHRPAGIFTERDVLNRLPGSMIGSREERSRVAVRDYMTGILQTIRRQDSLEEAVKRMIGHQCRHLVVVDGDGGLRGLLTTNDLVQFLTDQFPEQTFNLPPRLHATFQHRGGA